MSKLHLAILEVMKEVGYIQKSGEVSFGKTNYKFAGEADLIRAVRPVMMKNGLNMAPTGISDITVLPNKVVANYTFTLTHAESGESMQVCALGEGQDSGDKCSYKAATGALKYVLRQSFIIETGDDPDVTSSEELHSNLLDDKARKEAWAQFCKETLQKMANCTTSEELEGVLTEADWDKVNKKLRKDVPEYFDSFMVKYDKIYNDVNA